IWEVLKVRQVAFHPGGEAGSTTARSWQAHHRPCRGTLRCQAGSVPLKDNASQARSAEGTAMNSDARRDLSQLSPLFRAPASGPILDVLGVTHSYKVMASDTGQQFSIWESIVPPGRGAPVHTHTREDEAFYVLSGELLVDVEGATDPLRLGTGAFLFAPRHR